MGIRQPSRTATFFKQAQAGAEAQKEARETLKKPQALGGAAAAGTQMVASTTGAQQKATQEVQTKSGEMIKTVSADKVTTPTATAGAYTTADPTKLPGATPTSIAPSITTTPNVQYNTVKIGGMSVKIPVPVSNASQNVDNLTANQTAINASIKEVDDAIKKHDDGLQVLSEQDLKALADTKKQLMTQWQTYDDALRKENLGQIAGPSTFETEMQKREQVLATEGQNVGKLRALFGPRFDSERYGALASQIYGKDLEAIQETAAAGLEEQARTEERADVAEKEYVEKLGTTKKSVEEKVKSEQEKIDTLKIGWEALKNRGETLTSLTKLFGSDAEAKKYFNFDDKGNLISDKRSQVRDALVKKQTDLKTELGKTETKLKTEEDRAFNDISGELVVKDKYGNITGGSLPRVKSQISDIANVTVFSAANGNERRDIANRYLNNLASVEAEINNAIASKNGKKVKESKDKLNALLQEYKGELKKLEQPAPMTKDIYGNEVINTEGMLPGKSYRASNGKLYGKPLSTKIGQKTLAVEIDENGKFTGKVLPPPKTRV